MKMSENEVWKDVVGYEGLYKVSNKGNVYSVGRRDSRGSKIGGRILKPSPNTGGYLLVDLCKNGIRESKRVHRLVAQAFIPNYNKYLEINHKDENKTNNNVSNLEWCTREHNINHGTRTERAIQAQSKKVRAVNVESGEVLTFSSTNEAGRKGYDQSNVSLACRGLYYGGNLYKEYEWCYE